MRQVAATGAMGRVGTQETAFAQRHGQFMLNMVPGWFDPAESAQHIQWARDFWTATEPYATGGAYLNFLSDDGQERVRAAYGPNYDRLMNLKNKYDPTNVFRLNQNIAPTARST